MSTGVVVRRPSQVYVGMLALSALLTAVGCGLLVLELGDYEWDTAPKGPTLTVPALPPEGAPAPPAAGIEND